MKKESWLAKKKKKLTPVLEPFSHKGWSKANLQLLGKWDSLTDKLQI